MTWSIPYTLFIVALVAMPSLLARGVYMATGDPLWQYLAIDEERLAAAETDIESTSPYVRVRVYWRGGDETYETPEEVVLAIRNSFELKGIEPFIAVLDAPPGNVAEETTVDFRAGTNRFGPFPVWDAARHVQPAVRAAHLAFRPDATEEHRW